MTEAEALSAGKPERKRVTWTCDGVVEPEPTPESEPEPEPDITGVHEHTEPANE